MASKDYYSILGVSKDAKDEEIRAKYRDLARQWHPDTKNDPDEKAEAESRFKDINEANAVLSDPQQRQQYDFSRSHPGMQFTAPDMHGHGGPSLFDLLNGRLFESFGAHRQRVPVNQNIVGEVILTPEETLQSIQRNVKYDRQVFCEICNGTGGDKETCGTCGGSGQVSFSPQPMASLVQPCPVCRGQGQSIINRCGKCVGNGFTVNKEKVTIDVPAGSVGKQQVFSGRGHHRHKSAPPGDCVLQFTVRDTDRFNVTKYRNGDVETEIKIDPVVGIVGGTCSVQSLSGSNLSVNIPPGTKMGDRLRLNGEGLMKQLNRRTDLIVLIGYDMPALSDKKKAILEEYIKLLQD